jgi:hypothetical protein
MIFLQPLDVHFDGCVHIARRVFSRSTGGDATGQIRAISGIVFTGFFDHNKKSVHRGDLLSLKSQVFI